VPSRATRRVRWWSAPRARPSLMTPPPSPAVGPCVFVCMYVCMRPAQAPRDGAKEKRRIPDAGTVGAMHAAVRASYRPHIQTRQRLGCLKGSV